MISPLTLLLYGMIAMVVLVPIIFMLANKGFKNKAWIARQTGPRTEDVIWVEDKFKVVSKDGVWEIKFQKLKEKTRSIPGTNWTRYLKPGSQRVVLKYPKDEWEKLQMKKHLLRGLFLYETTEGEFYPMTLQQRDGQALFGVLDQDNRQFVINEIQAVNDLTRNQKKEISILMALIIGIIVIAIIFIAGMYFQAREHTANLANIAQVCSDITQTVLQQNKTTTPSFVGQAAQALGG